MGYLVGTDEAGYAPNLGPLVISATVWRVPGDPCGVDLYKLLRKVVARTPPARPRQVREAVNGQAAPARRPRAHPIKARLADSKVLYRPPGGLAALELGLLSCLALLGQRPATWRELWQLLDGQSAAALESLPWHLDYDCPLPLEADLSQIDAVAQALGGGVEAAGVRLLAIRSRAVFPDRFNRLTDEHGNKANALSWLTLDLLSGVLSMLDGEPVAVICDKHGGRNDYRALLQNQVADCVVEVYAEGRSQSVYRWGADQQRTEVLFCAKGERFLPAALASMASKYLRELSMRAFNHYWCRHVPQLRPTAGYPTDAGRFMADIAAARASLGIQDQILWRNR
ncbi:MAG: hypothetical protein WD403_01610 [Pirellulales bacterium]